MDSHIHVNQKMHNQHWPVCNDTRKGPVIQTYPHCCRWVASCQWHSIVRNFLLYQPACLVLQKASEYSIYIDMCVRAVAWSPQCLLKTTFLCVYWWCFFTSHYIFNEWQFVGSCCNLRKCLMVIDCIFCTYQCYHSPKITLIYHDNCKKQCSTM